MSVASTLVQYFQAKLEPTLEEPTQDVTLGVGSWSCQQVLEMGKN